MSASAWLGQLTQDPAQAVADLLRGAAAIAPYERASPHEFLLAVLPRASRRVRGRLLGDRGQDALGETDDARLGDLIDQGLSIWLTLLRSRPLPAARKLSAYVAQVCEALQWPLFFDLPRSVTALKTERAQWLAYFQSLTLSAYRDPEFEYWQVLASAQTDDSLQHFWHSFVNEAGRTRSLRYVDCGLQALASLPLNEDDSLRNLRLQITALVKRCSNRKALGPDALSELADKLRTVRARNLSMTDSKYFAFLTDGLLPLGEDKRASVLALLGLASVVPGLLSPRHGSLHRRGHLSVH
jgi:hypothetical protein